MYRAIRTNWSKPAVLGLVVIGITFAFFSPYFYTLHRRQVISFEVATAMLKNLDLRSIPTRRDAVFSTGRQVTLLLAHDNMAKK